MHRPTCLGARVFGFYGLGLWAALQVQGFRIPLVRSAHTARGIRAPVSSFSRQCGAPLRWMVNDQDTVAEGDEGYASPSADALAVDIFEAITSGDADAVEAYVKAGGDLTAADSNGDTPLLLAAENHLVSVIKLMVEEGGVDVDAASGASGETALMLAAYYGYTAVVQVLVEECAASVDKRNTKGETALCLAAFWGNVESVRYLLGAGADPDARDGAGKAVGEAFDSVFVKDTVPALAPADMGGSSGGGGVAESPRATITRLLAEAREAAAAASSQAA